MPLLAHLRAMAHLLAMQVVTCGDIGHPASVLCKRFPELAEPLGALPELWWYTGKPGKANCALQKRFESHETKQQLDVSCWGAAGWHMVCNAAAVWHMVCSVGRSQHAGRAWAALLGGGRRAGIGRRLA